MFSLPRSRSGPAPLRLNHNNVAQVKETINSLPISLPSCLLQSLQAHDAASGHAPRTTKLLEPICKHNTAFKMTHPYSHRGKDWEWIISLCSLPATPYFRKAYHTFYRNSSWQMRAFSPTYLWSLCPNFVAVIEFSSLWGLIKLFNKTASLPHHNSNSRQQIIELKWNRLACLLVVGFELELPWLIVLLTCQVLTTKIDAFGETLCKRSVAAKCQIHQFDEIQCPHCLDMSFAVCIYLTSWHLLFKVKAFWQSRGL